MHGLEARGRHAAQRSAYANEGAASIADLLAKHVRHCKRPFTKPTAPPAIVLADHEYFDNLLKTLPDAYRVLGRQALNGDFFSFYLCDMALKLNGKGGQPVYVKMAGQNSGRCTPQ